MRLSTYIIISAKDREELARSRLYLLKMLKDYSRLSSVKDAQSWCTFRQVQERSPDLEICHLDIRIKAKVKDRKRWREI